MPFPWYERAEPNAELQQGDFILNCYLLGWADQVPVIEDQNEEELLRVHRETIRKDIIVMTQSCDIEQGKVKEIVACPIYGVTEFKASWEAAERGKEQNPTPRKWKGFCKDIQDGFIWNYAMLNSGGIDDLRTEHRIVDFHELYTLPLEFLKAVARQRGPRLRLAPPYREHLAQAFARYFMRVGLPSPMDAVPD